jgi:hypothetical protein
MVLDSIYPTENPAVRSFGTFFYSDERRKARIPKMTGNFFFRFPKEIKFLTGKAFRVSFVKQNFLTDVSAVQTKPVIATHGFGQNSMRVDP